MIQAFCFDMDGVLFDTERVGGETLFASAARQGVTLDEKHARQIIGSNMAATKAAMEGWYPGRLDGDRFIADWCVIMLERMRREGMPIKPGARETLASLRRRGLPLALCTSNAPDVTREYLRLSRLGDAFDAVITGDMTTRGKPAPDIYLLGASRLGVAPQACVGVEDSYSGVKSLRAAGLKSVMIPDLLPYVPALAPYVDMCLPSLGALEQAVFGQDKEEEA